MAHDDARTTTQHPQQLHLHDRATLTSLDASNTSSASSSEERTEQWTNSSEGGSVGMMELVDVEQASQVGSAGGTTASEKTSPTSASKDGRGNRMDSFIILFILVIANPFLFSLNCEVASLSAIYLVQHTRLAMCSFFDLFCPVGESQRERFEQAKAEAARTASVRAQQAVDIFSHLNELSEPQGASVMSLHPVECFELAHTVERSHGLPYHEHIAQQLHGLGEWVRIIKNDVVDLGAQGWQKMHEIVHEFDVLDRLLNRLPPSSGSPSSITQRETVQKLDAYVDRIDESIQELLTSLDEAIPRAARGVHSAAGVHKALGWSGDELQRRWDDTSGFVKFFDNFWGGGGKATRVRKDMELVAVSMSSVVKFWRGLEDTRAALQRYATRAGQFKATIVGRHFANHGLSAEDEIASLKDALQEMRQVVYAAGGQGSKVEMKQLE